jgi:hypothetical protein
MCETGDVRWLSRPEEVTVVHDPIPIMDIVVGAVAPVQVRW